MNDMESKYYPEKQIFNNRSLRPGMKLHKGYYGQNRGGGIDRRQLSLFYVTERPKIVFKNSCLLGKKSIK